MTDAIVRQVLAFSTLELSLLGGRTLRAVFAVSERPHLTDGGVRYHTSNFKTTEASPLPRQAFCALFDHSLGEKEQARG